MELFDDLAQSMAGVEELTTALSDRLMEAVPHNLGTGPTDLGLDDIKDAPETPKTPGVGLCHGSSERRTGGLSASGSKSNIKRGISSASLAAMESLRGEPEIWQVCVASILSFKSQPRLDQLLRSHSHGRLLLNLQQVLLYQCVPCQLLHRPAEY